MVILSIETSCDETSLAVVRITEGLNNPKVEILREIVFSQINIHKEFGGVVPSLAKREHIKNLPILFEKLKDDKWNMDDVDLISVVVGPGLEPALWTGINFANELGKKYSKKIIGVNHLHGHMYSFLLSAKKNNLKFPAIVLLVSGGHTILISMESLFEYKKLGETLDDSIGESFDKVARILGLSYPGGPEIERLAKKGNENAIKFPMPMINSGDYNFSYSGLKTAVLYYLKNNGVDIKNFSPENSEDYIKMLDEARISRNDVAASFQKSALGIVASKSIKAIKKFNSKSIIIGGGVAANKKLRKMIEKLLKENDLKKVDLLVPEMKYCMDNASMSALSAYLLTNKTQYPLEANGLLDI